MNETEVKLNEEVLISRNNPKILLKWKSRNQMKTQLQKSKSSRDDKDSSESDISFDLNKRKTHRLYANDITGQAKGSDKFKDIDADETPEPDLWIAATEPNIVAYFDQIFKTETEITTNEEK